MLHYHSLKGARVLPKAASTETKHLRTNLIRLTGENPKGMDAHHVFPQEFRKMFEKMGINIDNGKYGTWWERSPHRSNARDYNHAWERFLKKEPSSEEILEFGREIMDRYHLPVNY